MVSTHLKHISQNGNLPQVGVKIKNVGNHHLAVFFRGVQFILNSFGNPLLLSNLFVVAQHLWARLLLPAIMPKVKKNCCSTTQNLHQCSPIWKQKKRVWRAFQHLPFQDPCHLSKSNFSCHLAFYSITNFIKCFISREAFFVCILLIYNFDFNKFQPPFPSSFHPNLLPSPFPWLRPTGNRPRHLHPVAVLCEGGFGPVQRQGAFLHIAARDRSAHLVTDRESTGPQ